MTKKDREAMRRRIKNRDWQGSVADVTRICALEVDRAVRKARREERARHLYPVVREPDPRALANAFDAAMKRRQDHRGET